MNVITEKEVEIYKVVFREIERGLRILKECYCSDCWVSIFKALQRIVDGNPSLLTDKKIFKTDVSWAIKNAINNIRKLNPKEFPKYEKSLRSNFPFLLGTKKAKKMMKETTAEKRLLTLCPKRKDAKMICEIMLNSPQFKDLRPSYLEKGLACSTTQLLAPLFQELCSKEKIVMERTVQKITETFSFLSKNFVVGYIGSFFLIEPSSLGMRIVMIKEGSKLPVLPDTPDDSDFVPKLVEFLEPIMFTEVKSYLFPE